MLKHCCGFLIEQFRGVDSWQTKIQHFLDGYPILGTGLLPFAPIKYQLPCLECVQQISGGCFDLLAV